MITIKNNFGFRQNNLSFYRPILIILQLCGYDFDYYNINLVLNVLTKAYCASLTCVVVYATIACCSSIQLSHIWSLIEYGTSVVIIACFRSQTKLFLKQLTTLDVYLRISNRSFVLEKCKIFTITAVIFLLRIVYTSIYCSTHHCFNVLIYFLLSQFALVCLDVNRIWRCIVFDAIRYRLKTLRLRIEENPDCNYYLYVKNNKSIRKNKISFCLFLYRTIADLVDLVSPELNVSVSR